jgi:hypothetical protein
MGSEGLLMVSWPQGLAEHHSSHESVAEKKRARVTPKDTHQSPTSYNWLHLPQFYHLLMVCSKFESINGLNHSLGQSCHDLKLSGNTFISWTYPEV